MGRSEVVSGWRVVGGGVVCGGWWLVAGYWWLVTGGRFAGLGGGWWKVGSGWWGGVVTPPPPKNTKNTKNTQNTHKKTLVLNRTNAFFFGACEQRAIAIAIAFCSQAIKSYPTTPQIISNLI